MKACEHCGTALPARPPNTGGPKPKYCSARCRRDAFAAKHATPCVDCGAPIPRHNKYQARQCGECARTNKTEHWQTLAAQLRREEIQVMWQDGKSLREIADTIGTSVPSVGVNICRMRHHFGMDMPYRYNVKDGKRCK